MVTINRRPIQALLSAWVIRCRSLRRAFGVIVQDVHPLGRPVLSRVAPVVLGWSWITGRRCA